MSAGVRLVHQPTGLAVKCTEHRTQQQNRATAMERLVAKLLVVLEEQQAAALADIRGDIVKAEWGQQIRNYGMYPVLYWGRHWRCRGSCSRLCIGCFQPEAVHAAVDKL
jgi:protein subunit release factor B